MRHTFSAPSHAPISTALRERIARVCFGDRCCSSRLDQCWCLPERDLCSSSWPCCGPTITSLSNTTVSWCSTRRRTATWHESTTRSIACCCSSRSTTRLWSLSPEIRRLWHVCLRCCVEASTVFQNYCSLERSCSSLSGWDDKCSVRLLASR